MGNYSPAKSPTCEYITLNQPPGEAMKPPATLGAAAVEFCKQARKRGPCLTMKDRPMDLPPGASLERRAGVRATAYVRRDPREDLDSGVSGVGEFQRACNGPRRWFEASATPQCPIIIYLLIMPVNINRSWRLKLCSSVIAPARMSRAEEEVDGRRGVRIGANRQQRRVAPTASPPAFNDEEMH